MQLEATFAIFLCMLLSSWCSCAFWMAKLPTVWFCVHRSCWSAAFNCSSAYEWQLVYAFSSDDLLNAVCCKCSCACWMATSSTVGIEKLGNKGWRFWMSASCNIWMSVRHKLITHCTLVALCMLDSNNFSSLIVCMCVMQLCVLDGNKCNSRWWKVGNKGWRFWKSFKRISNTVCATFVSLKWDLIVCHHLPQLNV